MLVFEPPAIEILFHREARGEQPDLAQARVADLDRCRIGDVQQRNLHG
jgi:hypothetical protein